MIFNNRRYFTKQIFEIQHSCLNVDKKTLFEAIEYDISFEQIDHKKKVQILFNHGWLVTGVFFSALGFLFQIGPNEGLSLSCFFIALIFTIMAFSLKKKVITIAVYDGSNIELYFTDQNKEEVLDFALQIINAANQHLLKKYGKVDLALPIEQQLHHIQFLRNREVITEEEYDALKNQLLGRKEKASIGFGN